MSHIFISYSKQNIDFARHLRRLLQDQGFSVWMDETQLGASERWWSRIEANIIDSSAFIVIMSPESKTSDWVEREILVAEDPDHAKPIFPILLSGKGWSRLANIQFENMTAGLNATLTPTFVAKLATVAPRGGAGAPPPLPGAVLPSPTIQKGKPPRRFSEGILVAIITGIFAIVVALIGIVPNLQKAAPTATPSDSPTSPPTVAFVPFDTTATQITQLLTTATESFLQRTVDAQQATNAFNLTENAHIAATFTAQSYTATPAPTNTPPPTAMPVPTLSPTPPPPEGTVQLQLFADGDSLTLYVSQTVSLEGMEFVVVDNGSSETKALKDAFPILTLTQFVAQSNTCFVYQLSNTSSVLSEACNGQVFKYTVALADLFWYDTTANRLRDIAIFRNGAATGDICSAAQLRCNFNWSIS